MTIASTGQRRRKAHARRPVAASILCLGLLGATPAMAQTGGLLGSVLSLVGGTVDATLNTTLGLAQSLVHLPARPVLHESQVICDLDLRRERVQVRNYGRAIRASRAMDSCTSFGANTQ